MTVDQVAVRGVVRGGVIVPDEEVRLEEGTVVQILLDDPIMSPELKAEFAAWDKASAEAWAMIDRWEREDPR